MSVCHKAWCFEHWMTCKADAQSWPSLGSPHLNSSLLHWALNFSTRRLNIHRPILMLWNAIVKCLALLHRVQEVLDCNLSPHRGKSPNTGRFPNMGRCIISYQEVLHSLLKSVNEVFALLGRYAALIGSYLPTFRESLSLGLLNHWRRDRLISIMFCWPCILVQYNSG